MAPSIQQCWEIVFLHLHRLEPKLSLRSIAKEVQCSPDTVQSWIIHYQKTGDVQDQPGQGHKRKTSNREDMDIATIAKKYRTSSSAHISTLMSKQGVNISSVTVRHQLNEQGLYKLKPLSMPLLSVTHRLNHFKWAKTHKKQDWSKIIFTDETTFSQFNKPKTVWRSKGEIVKAPTVKHSAQVHVYGCFSEKGFGRIYCFTENLNGNLLCTIYKNTLLPSVKTLFGKNNNNWILQ